MITVTRYEGKVKLSHMGHIIWLTNAEAKELAVELYKMSDGGGDGTVTVTAKKEKDMDRFTRLAEAMNTMHQQFDYSDGEATGPTQRIEELERAVHNVVECYKPSDPDIETTPCHWNCDYCKENDKNKGVPMRPTK